MLTACIEKQPIDYEYYHQTRGISYQDGEDSPFTEEEINQAQKDEELLQSALNNTVETPEPKLWENEIHRICVTEMGFPLGTTSYSTCRSFYEQQVYQYGIDINAVTTAQIAAFLAWTNPIISNCRKYGYAGDSLWKCTYRGEHRHFRAWSHHHPHYRKWDHRPHHSPKHPYKPLRKNHHSPKHPNKHR
jgi:hypothetical protein